MYSPRTRAVAGLVMRLLLGVVFILSACAKLWSVDQFELYIYSYGFFSLDLSMSAARLCIGVELALGILLMTGWWRRATLTATALLLLLFSLFLGYAALAGRNDSCQCFGQLADMPPAVSLLKNAVLLSVTLLCTRLSAPGRRRRWHTWAVAATTAVALAVPFVVSVPDNWMFGASEERYDAEALDALVDGPLADKEIRTGNKVVAFVTPGCPYCRAARQKLDYIARRNKLSDDNIIYIEPNDIGTSEFLRVTYGATPLLLLTEEGSVCATFHYRNIDERRIVRALVR